MRAPLLCKPEEKAERETANGDRQLDYIAHLVNEVRIEQVRSPMSWDCISSPSRTSIHAEARTAMRFARS